MPEEESEDRLLRVDLYDIENKLDLIDTKLAAIPTQGDLTRVALLAPSYRRRFRPPLDRGAVPIKRRADLSRVNGTQN
jgi:hypothetical protein